MRRSVAAKCEVAHLRLGHVMAVAAVLACCGILGVVRAPVSLGMDTAGTLAFGGLDRTYLLHVPAGVDHPAGLVINLHGAGMTGGAQASLTNYNAVADQHGFAVVYPDGIDLSWADGRGASLPDRQGVDDVGFLVALADRLTARSQDRSRQGVRDGIVGGGIHGDAAGVPTRRRRRRHRAGRRVFGFGSTCAPSRPVSVFATHGMADPVVPYAAAAWSVAAVRATSSRRRRWSARWRELDRCPAAPVEDVPGPGVHRFTSAGCANGTEVVFVGVDGGGHEWFGGRIGRQRTILRHARQVSSSR